MSLPTNYKSTGGFDANGQKVLNLADATNPPDALNLRTFDAKNTVQPYNQLRTYNPDFIVEYAGQLWKCISITGGQFDRTKWTAIRGTENWIRITGPYTASPMDTLYVDTFTTPLTVTLPSNPKSGDYVRIIDAGNADKNAITIAGNGSTIDGGTGNSILVKANSQITAIYLGGTWTTTFDLTINRVRFITTTETVTANTMYTMLVNSSFTITLPQNPRKGDWVALTDQLGTVGSNPITVSGTDKQINGQNSFVINQKKATWHIIYDGTGWITYALTGDALLAVNNLSEIANKPQARTNLGLGSLATYDQGVDAGQVRLNGQNDLVYQARATILTNLSQLVLSANKLIYATGPNTLGITDFTAAARLLLAAATDVEQRAALQLGTAATRNVGTQVNDLMSVGAFGLGKTPPFAGNIDDTSVVPRGWVIVDTANAGTTGTFPTGSARYAGTLHTFGDSNGVGVRQMFHTIVGQPGGFTNLTYVRDQYVNNWGPWRTFLYGNPANGDLGTAAYRDVGTQQGNLLEVGAYGFGGSAPLVLDLNALSGTQFFITGPTTVNDPPGFGTGDGKQGYGYQITHSSPAWRMQQWTNVNSMRTFQRICIASTNTWTGWVELITTGNAGDAVLRNVGTSLGNVMEVSAGGWLSRSGNAINVDLNTIDATQTFYCDASCPNSPQAGYGQLFHLQFGDARFAKQTFSVVNGDVEYIRYKIVDVWQPWYQVFSSKQMYPAWTQVTAQNGWNVSGVLGANGLAYRKEGKRVYLRGVATKSTTDAPVICTLPSGFRPQSVKLIPTVVDGGAPTYVGIYPSGAIQVGVYQTANATVLFDNMSFEID